LCPRAQHFSGGVDGRSSSVRFICPESWRDEDGIVVVHEPRPKQYVINLRVHAMCSGSKQKATAPTPASNRRKATAIAKGAAAGGATSAGAGGASRVARTAGTSTSGPMQIAEMAMPSMRLLSPLRGRCFSMTVDYWTYELCPQQHTRQLRLEGSRVGVEFNLGKYDQAEDKVTVGVRGSLDKSLLPHTFSQGYVNGTAGRRSTVRVRCANKNEHALVGIEEPQTHNYVLIFSTPLACELSCTYAQPPKVLP
jgi:hypothetical protein